ncbi:hypothetical protein NQ317_013316 [Molorchus minor]|uniref:C2H2-type domain-containing protein n=1 Tax=Molorchus minor TaxID=1323400 RepID=A0ABQ9J1Z5_9CUCU|nr:hypothetical protein NQ317_013316 [Molorchus minor]
MLKNHVQYCGVSFDCCDCQASYSLYETLKTHGRRKKHNILLKPSYKSRLSEVKSEELITTTDKFRLILPKQSVGLVVLSSKDKTTINRESQTEEETPKLRSKMTQINRDVIVSQNSQQTQTGSKFIQLTAETQTIGDFLDHKKIEDMLNDTNKLKTSITQTDIILSRSTSSNTSFNLEDFEFTIKPDIKKNSFGTQTTYDLLVETLRNNLNSEMNNFEFYNSETQTDFMLDDEMFNCDYMSNMYTQTCDILSDLGFSDIQTQTVFDDLLRSVESQTLMSHARKNNGIFKDTTHMETQTDMEFRQMLEVINS